ncbi:MAG: extensin-like domain-containing protein [Pseudooceanicola nanhaiensis]|uniref:extensin-like domain-containing protein n=1 Tax=Pseudooceanicola nanhaiensis TaxID=375761 RepID=UPI0040590D8E
MRWLPLVLIFSTAGGALADAPSRSLRPQARAVQAEATVARPAPAAAAEARPAEPSVTGGLRSALRPKARDDAGMAEQLAAASAAAQEAAAQPKPQAQPQIQQEVQTEQKPTVLDLLRGAGKPAAPSRTAAAPQRETRPEDLGVKREVEKKPNTLLALLRPRQRSRNVEDNARRVDAAKRGKMVCGVEDIQGISIGNVSGKGACGVQDAVRISSVAGVSLSTHAVMDCTTARALNAWVAQAARPAIGTLGGGLSELRVAAHYVCRTRNNQRGAKLSEHGRGHAIDISGFKLRNGQELSVLRDWSGNHAKVMRAMHKAACGPFGTVLGPNADRFHRDHFHLDTARYRAGTYCR